MTDALAAAAGIQLAHPARNEVTRTFGLPTFSAARLQSSAFTIIFDNQSRKF